MSRRITLEEMTAEELTKMIVAELSPMLETAGPIGPECLHSFKTVAGRLDISERQVRNLVTKGDLRSVKVESSPKIRESDLLAYIEKISAAPSKAKAVRRTIGRRKTG